MVFGGQCHAERHYSEVMTMRRLTVWHVSDGHPRRDVGGVNWGTRGYSLLVGSFCVMIKNHVKMVPTFNHFGWAQLVTHTGAMLLSCNRPTPSTSAMPPYHLFFFLLERLINYDLVVDYLTI